MHSIGILCILSIGLTTASQVRFYNNCGFEVEVVKTENGRGPVTECRLGARGGSCTKGYGGNGMNFRSGHGDGKTLAEFSFNSWQGIDFYDLSVIVGYDIAMRIQPSTERKKATCDTAARCDWCSKMANSNMCLFESGGPTVTCTDHGCPDAYHYPKDDTKTHGTRTGGTFTLTFCP